MNDEEAKNLDKVCKKKSMFCSVNVFKCIAMGWLVDVDLKESFKNRQKTQKVIR